MKEASMQVKHGSRLKFNLRHTRGFIALLAFIMSASVVQASCPERGDVGKPIRLFHTNPFLESVFQHNANDINEIKRMYIDRNLKEVISTYENALLLRESANASSSIIFAYKDTEGFFEKAYSHTGWNSAVDVQVNQSLLDRGVINIIKVAEENVKIGNCSYISDVFRETTWLSKSGYINLLKYYASEIEMIVRVKYLNDNGDLIGDTTYDQISVLE
ncbi:hypothetical protein C8J36_12320 [Rhizobium sp. PP-F2F-G48]|uniref:hypothetical protein n=1 Tax=Rhizobium sp. PP-F2F-G48 TaxID=2135651 RepID=UPI00104598D8|nr:hypothetical protein [Rhizobium sp. PP-F2F-G48]TCM44848.1 hypothetical protein C8J36_12320 [Rhizobium sp. PP-F2F-G48]